MSNEIFPSTLNGYTWDSKKTPTFKTVTHSVATGRDVRIALASQPIYEFSLSNNWLTQADKNTLLGFFVARKGAFDSFLYVDTDSEIVDQAFGAGDGVTLSFQLTKNTASAVEIVNNVVGSPDIYIDDVLKTPTTDYVISGGLVTFVTPPDVDSVLTWTGFAYYRCVFMDDAQEYSQFASSLYECNEVNFKGSLANKL